MTTFDNIINFAKKTGFIYMVNEVDKTGMFFYLEGYYHHFFDVNLNPDESIDFTYSAMSAGYTDSEEFKTNVSIDFFKKKLNKIFALTKGIKDMDDTQFKRIILQRSFGQ